MTDRAFQAMDFSSSGDNVPTEMFVFAYPHRGGQTRGKVHLCFTRPNERGQFYEVDADTWNEIRKITATPSTNTGKD